MRTLNSQSDRITPLKYLEFGGEEEYYDFPAPLRIIVKGQKTPTLVFSANPGEKPEKPTTPDQPGKPEQPVKPEQPIKQPGQPKPERPIISPQQNEENRGSGDKPSRPIEVAKGAELPIKNKNMEKEENDEEYEVREEDKIERIEQKDDEYENKHNEREDTAF